MNAKNSRPGLAVVELASRLRRFWADDLDPLTAMFDPIHNPLGFVHRLHFAFEAEVSS
ncbi:MAG: hypothetical protein ACC628_18165 [Pirellulaceae bacterium]